MHCRYIATTIFLTLATAPTPCLFLPTASAGPAARAADVFAQDKLVAWCIVPFDASKRTPPQRAAMLQRLGIRRLAYDWRAEHVPSFAQEILMCKKHGIEFFAFWSPASANPGYQEMMRLIAQHQIKPQIWMIAPAAAAETNAQRVALNARTMLPFVEKAGQLGCPFGLYNHGGWAGEPENLIAMVAWLRRHSSTQRIGIVYNFHHGHEHLDRFPQAFQQMQPYLYCVNLNGMNAGGPKILPLGQGAEDLRLLRMIRDSGYDGPIGILDHRGALDAEQSLRENLQGLAKLRAALAATNVSGAAP
jgi:sugar phosphate isomerase/epimerase